MLKKIALLCAVLSAAAPLAAVEFQNLTADGVKIRAHVVEVKSLGDGEFLLTVPPAPNQWPLIHIASAEPQVKISSISVTLQLVEPGAGERISIECKPKGIAHNIAARNLLKDGKPHTFVLPLTPGKTLESMMISFAKPKAQTVLKLGKIAFQSAAPAPVKAALPPLPPVVFKGKPFFPLGCYDAAALPRTEFGIDHGFLDAGGNTMMIGALGMPGHVHYEKYRQPVLFRRLAHAAEAPEYRDLAFFVGLDPALTWDASEAQKQGIGGYHKPLTPEQIAERTQFLAEDLRKLRRCPNILGYMHDEPENLAYTYFKRHRSADWDAKREKALAPLMLDAYDWVHRLIRKEHPEAKLAPIIAWWTSYELLGDFYDINIPNEYPDAPKESPEFAGDFFTVNYDAAMAVAAARKLGGGRTVIYMPGMFQRETLPNRNRRTPTRRELRYTCFAPLTRGVMGIFGWRLLRCDASYRDNAVYPVLSEISELKDYFLGEWHDEKVSSDHDSAGVDYLRKFKEFSRMVADEKDGDIQLVKDAVPDVSYCLRRNPADGTFLLLTVNNRREPLTVTFQLALDNLPPTAKCAIDRHYVRIQNRSFTDSFAPFDVHAYIIKPTR